MGRSQIYVFCAALCILSLDQAAADQRDSLLTLGQQHLREGRAEAAVATFSNLTKTFPKDAHIQSRLGYAYLKNRDFEKAEAAFKTAKKLDQNLAEAYVGLGLVYAERPASGLSAYSNFRKAVGEAKRATKLDSTYGPAYRLLGELYERFQEDHQKAVEYYLKYIQVESDNPDGLYYFGLAGVITSGIRALLRQQKPQISVTYEQVGTDEEEREYVELDLKKAKPGVNVVEITVQDKVSGEKATREVVFFYGGSG